MGYFKEKYDEMKAKKDEKKALQAEAYAALQKFHDTVYFHHYKMKMDKHNQTYEQNEFKEIDDAIENVGATLAEIRKKLEGIKPESSGALLKTAEKISEPEGDPRYKTPKKEPAVPREVADKVIDENEIYMRAKESILNAQRRQVSYGIEKYPEPLKADTWTILETIRHIKEETVDTLHYLTMLEIKFEELAKSEVISAGRRMKEEAEEQSKQFYFADKPYDMNYEHVIECPAKECCGNPKGCEAAGTKLDSFGTDIKNLQKERGELRIPSKIEPPKTPNQGGMYLKVVEKEEVKPVDLEAVEAGILREEPIKVKAVKRETLAEFTQKHGLPYCTNGQVLSIPEHITIKSEEVAPGNLGMVRVMSEGLNDIPVIVRHGDDGIIKEDIRLVEMAVEEQIARAQLRRNL